MARLKRRVAYQSWRPGPVVVSEDRIIAIDRAIAWLESELNSGWLSEAHRVASAKLLAFLRVMRARAFSD